MLSSAPDSNDELIAQFLREHAVASDRAAHLKEWQRRHPHLAEEFPALASMEDRLDQSRPADEPMPKQLGEFQIVGRLGTGGMEEVFEAKQPSLNRRVVVKTIRRGQGDPKVRDRFLRQQRALAKLHHSHIVPIFAAGEEAGRQYFVMPYIEGASLNYAVNTARNWDSTPNAGPTPSLKEIAERFVRSHDHSAAPTVSSVSGPRIRPAETHPVLEKAAAAKPGHYPLSRAYFRSVAQVMADAADALQYAHDTGILHRDLKPANLMVDRHGQCWIIDFGLGRFLQEMENQAQEPSPSPGDGSQPQPALTTQGQILGTPSYMAVEQWQPGQPRVDHRSDIYGLGVTLFELLTLRRAYEETDRFKLQAQIEAGAAPAPRHIQPAVPADLDAICRKAMNKEPGKRHDSSKDMAEDLRRWLNGFPTEARPAQAPRRLWYWARRNKGWAAALAITLFFGFTLAVAAGVYRERQQEGHRQSLMRQAQGLRLTFRQDGWSDAAAKLVREAAHLRADDALRNEAAALLIGLDARKDKVFPFAASSVAFDAEGKRLLMGGLKDRGASLWREPDAAPITSEPFGWGPVAFRGQTPLHLVVDPKNPMQRLLWDVEKNQLVHSLIIPGKVPVRHETEPTMALSADGLFAAAAVQREDKTHAIAVWATLTGKLLRTFEIGATALAFSPKGELLAAGQEDGTVQVWALPNGEPVATLKLEGNNILSLAFGRATVFYGSADDAPRWLLAAGDFGGNVTVWDLEKKLPRTLVRGSSGEALALAFSGDGVTLASATRGRINLIDIATGRLLLDVDAGNIITGLAYSPDGQKLAASYLDPWAKEYPSDEVAVWQIEEGRGIQTLRGLDSSLVQVWFSPDGNLVAGLSYNWKVGIWEQKTGRLQHMIAVPPGVTPDNASLAFHPDGKKFAFAAGRHAALWDLATGKRIGEPWKLGKGTQDQLVYHPQGKLVLFRVETSDPEVPPFGGTDHKKYPRLCRLSELQAGKPLQELKTITTLHRGVIKAALSPNGKYLAVDGHGGRAGADRFIMVFDGLTGAELWRLPSQYKPLSRSLEFDPTERHLAVSGVSLDDIRGLILEASTGKALEEWPRSPSCFNTSTGYWCTHPPRPALGCSLYRMSDKKLLVTLGIDVPDVGYRTSFNRAGTHVAWGNRDGTIFVADIPTVQRKLAAVALGW